MVLIGKVTCYDTCFDDRETLINTDSAQHLQLQQTCLCDNTVRINFPDYCLKTTVKLTSMRDCVRSLVRREIKEQVLPMTQGRQVCSPSFLDRKHG